MVFARSIEARIALMAGLLLIGVAVAIDLTESIMDLKEIDYEVADLDDEALQMAR
jgi:hypothetical protein